MLSILECLANMILTIPSALMLAAFVPGPFIFLLITGFSCFGYNTLKKRKFSRIDFWNLTPILIIWITITMSYSIYWEKSEYEFLLIYATIAYIFSVSATLFSLKRRLITCLGIQSFIGIYAIGQYLLCSMAIGESWL